MGHVGHRVKHMLNCGQGALREFLRTPEETLFSDFRAVSNRADGRPFEFLQAIAQLIARNAQQLSSPRLIAAAPVHRLLDQTHLHRFELNSFRRQAERLVYGSSPEARSD
jgi:hypothetical protein